MIKPNMRIGEVFEDGGRRYEVTAVIDAHTYISRATDKPLEVEKVKEDTEVKVTAKPKTATKKPVTKKK